MSAGISTIKQTLGGQWWTLQRFGFSPEKAQYRFLNRVEPRILCVSIPKAGTHLLERALCLYPGLYRKLMPTVNDSNIQKWGDLTTLLEKLRPGQVIMSHLNFTRERLQAIKASDVRCIFMIRDPRDVVISQAFYISRKKNHPLHDVFVAQNDLKDRIKLAIKGYSPGGLPSIGQRLENGAGWLNSGALIVRFEDLIGAQGGGDKSRQVNAIYSIYEFIRMNITENRAIQLGQKLFASTSPTFHKGAIGQWKKYFDSEIKYLFKREASKALVQYGYDW